MGSSVGLCTVHGCNGVRTPATSTACWAHDDKVAKTTLRQLSEGADLDARGILITPELLDRILSAAPRRTKLVPKFANVDFDGATFEGEASFDMVVFEGRASFYRAVFESVTTITGVFKNVTNFSKATFKGGVVFTDTTFQQDATFSEAAFRDWVAFDEVIFEAAALFDGATFQTARQFGPVLVRNQLDLDEAIFRERVQIEATAALVSTRRVRFLAGAQLRLRWAMVVLEDTDFAASSILTGVPRLSEPFDNDQFDEDRFASAWRAQLPPMGRREGRPRLLSLRRADVAGLTMANVDLRACRFLGAHNLDKLRIESEDSFHYTPHPGWTQAGFWATRQTIAEEHHWRSQHDTPSNRKGWYPPECQPPDWLDDTEQAPEPVEIAGLYRSLRKGREDSKDEPGAADFYYGEMDMRRQVKHQQARDAWMRQEADSETADASVRRARGRRGWGRWATAQTEHTILWLYWAVSGYGLRAWRALAAFLALLIVFAMLFVWIGFAQEVAPTAAGATAASQTPTTTMQLPNSSTPITRYPGATATTGLARESTSTTLRTFTSSTAPSAPSSATPAADTSFVGALAYGARTVIGLGREPQPRLTRWGDAFQILLRLLGPVLLGLAILSIRGRVKR
jgi:uncharacterized protein YjbI with pentapeptide repeats